MILTVSWFCFYWNYWRTSPRRTTDIKAAQDMYVCPECGASAEEITFDTEGWYFSLLPTFKCRRCGYEWYYTPPAR